MNVSKSLTSLAVAAFALSAVVFSAPMAEAKGGVTVAPTKQVKTMQAKLSNKKGAKLVKQASIKQPLQIAQLDKKTEVTPSAEKPADTKKADKAAKKAAAKAEKSATKAEKATVKESKKEAKEIKPAAKAK